MSRARRNVGLPRVLREHLRDVRGWRGLSQVDLAQTLGVVQMTVCRWETGDRWPARDHVDAWAAALAAGVCDCCGRTYVERGRP